MMELRVYAWIVVGTRARMIALSSGVQGYAVAPISGKDGPGARRARKLLTAPQDKPAGARNWVRVIGGRWRSRRIRFESVPGLRPTPDRVRETLFNWLQAEVPGSRCLDLYAGSGALGIEALSRGAHEAVFVEADRRAAAGLEATLREFGATGASVVCADAFAFLHGPRPARPFDLVFLDPPYAQGRLRELCTLLGMRGWLAPQARIYLECAAAGAAPALPEGWIEWRRTRAGEALALLARRATPATAVAPAPEPAPEPASPP